jgi:pimeloyl-ACP methyl ester carboxylesterase
MATFCLVHGSWHGPWCFERLVPEIEAAGHAAMAVELDSDEPGSTCSDYADTVARALQKADDQVIVVGHSFGGLTIPLVAERRSVDRLVYLAALIPRPGMSMSEQFEVEDGILVSESGRDLDDQGRSFWRERDAAIAAMYSDCSPEDAEWAWSRLRPQSRAAQNEPCPLDRFPEAPTSYVSCRDDRMVSADWGIRAARERLGVEPIEIAGGHTPQLSRPRELAETLVGLADRG